MGRLEEVLAKDETTPYREAFIGDLECDADERHLVMLNAADAWRCFFQEMPGPGPQLADFGEFGLVVRLTWAEMNG